VHAKSAIQLYVTNPHKEFNDNNKIDILQSKRVAILGVSGQIGRRLLGILANHGLPVENITATSQNETKVSYGTNVIETKTIDKVDFQQQDIVFNCTPTSTIEKYIGTLWDSGCIVIDKSSAFRMSYEVPLVVPEVNGELIKDSRLIASPNCIVVPLVMVLNAIWAKLSNVNHISVTTYQSVSGAGNAAMDGLLEETKRTFFEQKVIPKFFEKQIAFNVIPKIGEYDSEGHADEEVKIEQESNKILCPIFGVEKLPMSVTCVRVPTLIGHGISLDINCNIIGGLPAVESALLKSTSIQYSGDVNYVSITDCAYEDLVYVSRLRRTTTGIAMWIVCDNVGRGGALNGFQIAQMACGDLDFPM